MEACALLPWLFFGLIGGALVDRWDRRRTMRLADLFRLGLLAGVTGLELQDELWNRKKIRVRSQGGQLVRQSVHYYNSPEEIEGTLEVVRLLAAK